MKVEHAVAEEKLRTGASQCVKKALPQQQPFPTMSSGDTPSLTDLHARMSLVAAAKPKLQQSALDDLLRQRKREKGFERARVSNEILEKISACRRR